MSRGRRADQAALSLADVGEDRLLADITARLPGNAHVIAGAGDDCAVVRFGDRNRLLLLKTDCVVRGVHFDAAARPRQVGWKAMARPLSDFAAMSGVPQFALVTLLAPTTTSLRWTRALYRGLADAAGAFGVAIVGGETSATRGPAALSVSLSGYVEKNRAVLRSGGNAGDALYVTGRLGGSIRGKHLRFTPRINEARWLTEHFRIHAMIDLSDGLGADLPRLARASGVGFAIDEAAVPRTPGCTLEQAISDGEDYELLFAVPASESAALEREWKRTFRTVRLTRIGQLNRSSKIDSRKFPSGYVHFR